MLATSHVSEKNASHGTAAPGTALAALPALALRYPPTASTAMTALPLFVVSPHFDDAAFGCGTLLALHPGSVVCTVFAGRPSLPMSTSWDRSAGFAHSDAALEARRREDDRALSILAARGVRLGFLDSQYETPQSMQAIADALLDAWRAADSPPVVAPLGLFHSDHRLASDAVCDLLARGALPSAVAYEDALYRRIPNEMRARREALARRGFELDATLPDALAPLTGARAAAPKWRSVRAYRSQLRALDDAYPHDLAEPERYWRLLAKHRTRYRPPPSRG
ncbi:hypothetical protein Busp01_18750 [Trinickia caryophylli]|nr:hypothetical protein Busp01_18750 [Trinickia caryophylli]